MFLRKQSTEMALRRALPVLCLGLLLLANQASAIPITIIMESDVSTSSPDPGSSEPEIKTQLWVPPGDTEYKLKPEPTSITFRGLGDTDNALPNGSDGYFLIFDYAEITLDPFGNPEPAGEPFSTPMTLEFTSELALFVIYDGADSYAALTINLGSGLFLDLYIGPKNIAFDGWDIKTPLSAVGNGELTPLWGENGEVVQVKNPISEVAGGDVAGLYFEPQGTAGDDIVPLPVSFTATVPAPGTLALLMLGAGVLLLRRAG